MNTNESGGTFTVNFSMSEPGMAESFRHIFSPAPVMNKPIQVRLRVRGGLHGKRIFPQRGMHRRKQMARLVDVNPFPDGPAMGSPLVPLAIPKGATMLMADLDKQLEAAALEAIHSGRATFSYFPPEGKTHMEP